jgi:hypothetical protein
MGKARTREQLESTTQEQIVDLFSALAKKYSFVFFSVPNESALIAGRTGKTTMAIMGKLKRMGLTVGVADLVIGCDGRMYCMEVKSVTGKQTANQALFGAWALSCGIPYELVRSVKDAVVAMQIWGILPRSFVIL